MNRRQFFKLGALAAVAPKAIVTAGSAYARTTVRIQGLSEWCDCWGSPSVPGGFFGIDRGVVSGLALREWLEIVAARCPEV